MYVHTYISQCLSLLSTVDLLYHEPIEILINYAYNMSNLSEGFMLLGFDIIFPHTTLKPSKHPSSYNQDLLKL